LSGIIFFGYPYFASGYRSVNLRQQELRDQLAKDYFLLTSLLTEHLGSGNRSKTQRVMKNFFTIQNANVFPYHGLVLLDADKKIVNAVSIKAGADDEDMIGSSYAAIKFTGGEDSLHRVLTLYRAEKNHPMGKEGVEVAFELHRDDEFVGWLVFQMDMEMLRRTHGVDTHVLHEFQFAKQ
jgi:hypothetical protein